MKSIQRYELRRTRVQLAEDPEFYRTVTHSSDVAKIVRALIGDCTQEVLIVLYLNVKNKVLGYHEAGRGGLTNCHAEPREIYRTAIAAGAAHVILAHNHPSGDPAPSADDVTFTSRCVQGGKLLGVPVTDHVIVGHDGRCFSFLDAGLLT